jgi:hypothetical protein
MNELDDAKWIVPLGDTQVGDERTTTHAIERTSPKGEGQKFIGTCINCGMENLTFENMNDPCPNTRNRTENEALLEIIKGPRDG